MFRGVLQAFRTAVPSNILNAENVLSQQTRNTMILKRKRAPRPHKKTYEPRKLSHREFVYEMVEDTSSKKKPDMQVVLTAFVDGIGNKGEVVSVRPNFAYNKLLLPGLAVYNTPDNLVKFKQPEGQKVEKPYSSRFAQRAVDCMERRVIQVAMNKFNSWTIEPWHIRASMRKAGINVLDESAIELPKQPITGPDPAKQNKEFTVTVTVNNAEKATVRCRIHHWSNDPNNREPYAFEHWKQPAEPLILNEQEN